MQTLALVHLAGVKEGMGLLRGGSASLSPAFALLCALLSEKRGR